MGKMKARRPQAMVALFAVQKQGRLSVDLPIRTVSELNDHEFWRVRHNRAKAQRSQTYMMLLGLKFPNLPARITFTRLSPRTLDQGDNLNSSFKHVRDEIARMYGVDDSDPRYTWMPCKQEKSKAMGVRVEIESI